MSNIELKKKSNKYLITLLLMVVGISGVLTLTNPVIAEVTIDVGNLLWDSDTAFFGTLDHAITANRTWTFPDLTGTVALLTGAQTFTGKTIDGDDNTLVDINESQMDVAVGESGQVLTSNGVGSPPTYQASAGGSTDLDGLTDVQIESLATDQILLSNGTTHFNNTDLKDIQALYTNDVPLWLGDEDVQEIFDSGHAWSLTSGDGTLSDDTTDFIAGTQSLQLVTGATSVQNQIDRTTLATPLDMRDKQFGFWIKTSDRDSFDNLRFQVSSDAFASNTWHFKLERDPDKHFTENMWQRVIVTWSEWTRDSQQSGTVDRSAINDFRFVIDDDGTTAITVNIDRIFTMDIPDETKPIVVLWFDDSFGSHRLAADKLSEYGYAGVNSVIPNVIGNSGRLNMTDLRIMHDVLGWDLVGHGNTALRTVDSATKESHLRTAKSFLLDNGFTRGSEHYVYVGGGWDDELYNMTKKYFSTARGIADYTESIPPADWHVLRGNLVDGSTAEGLANVVADTTNYKGHSANATGFMHYIFHDLPVCEPSCTGSDFDINEFGRFVDYLAGNETRVMTMTEAVHYINSLENERLADSEHIVYKEYDESVTFTINHQKDDELKFEVEPYSDYIITFDFRWDSHASADFNFRFDVPTDVTFTGGRPRQTVGSTQDLTGNVTLSSNGVGVERFAVYYATLESGANGGTVSLEWAQDLWHNSVATLQDTSYIKVQKIG